MEVRREFLSRFLGIALAILPLIWLVLSFFQLFQGTPEAFQRIGAFGVAVFILCFGITRPFVEEFKKLDEKGAFLEVEKATDLLERLQNQDVSALDEETRQTLIELRQHEALLRRMKSTEPKMRNFAEKFYGLEIGYGVVATLQWGYGDLFQCWYNGHGWTKCS